MSTPYARISTIGINVNDILLSLRYRRRPNPNEALHTPTLPDESDFDTHELNEVLTKREIWHQSAPPEKMRAWLDNPSDAVRAV
jgi:hypothetical protein